LIPHALKHGDPDWWMQTGELAYVANYQYINDNLLDLSHLSYVHENTLGRNSMAWANAKPQVARIGRGLRVSRWVVNHPAPKYLDQPQGLMTDMWTSYDYMAAGVFLLQTRSYHTGTAAACGMREPTAEPLWTTVTSQAVTPIDDRHTVYYYSGCLEKCFATEAQSVAQFAIFERAFAEDNAMIEAQQQVIWNTPEPRMLGTSSDHALNQFRRLMDELMNAETARPVAWETGFATARIPAQA
jgi:phenylpropionate dioxygenase-like ring-hydroxylating dioxygenase large terminal subunit